MILKMVHVCARMDSSWTVFQKHAKLVEPHALLATISIPARLVDLDLDLGPQNASHAQVTNSFKVIHVKTVVSIVSSAIRALISAKLVLTTQIFKRTELVNAKKDFSSIQKLELVKTATRPVIPAPMEYLAPFANLVSSLGPQSATSAKATSIFRRISVLTAVRTATGAPKDPTSAWCVLTT